MLTLVKSFLNKKGQIKKERFMKKIIVLSLSSMFIFSCLQLTCISHASDYKRDIKNNQRKIEQIKSSKTLSNNYKSREIRRLEKQNSYLRKMR